MPERVLTVLAIIAIVVMVGALLAVMLASTLNTPRTEALPASALVPHPGLLLGSSVAALLGPGRPVVPNPSAQRHDGPGLHAALTDLADLAPAVLVVVAVLAAVLALLALVRSGRAIRHEERLPRGLIAIAIAGTVGLASVAAVTVVLQALASGDAAIALAG